MYCCPQCGCEDVDRSLIGLTTMQRSVLDVIAAHQAHHGVSPTVREIRDQLNLTSIGNIQRTIGGLADRGWLIRRRHAARSLALTDQARNHLSRETDFPLGIRRRK